MTNAPEKLCFVNCGLPADQCACYRQYLDATFLPTILATEHDRAEALQAQLAEAREQRDRAIALAEKAQDRLIEAMDRVDEARDKARSVADAYDRANPMRTADIHRDGCDCLRCAVDAIRAMKGEGG